MPETVLDFAVGQQVKPTADTVAIQVGLTTETLGEIETLEEGVASVRWATGKTILHPISGIIPV